MNCQMTLTDDDKAAGTLGDESLARALAIYREQGCLALDNVFDPDHVARLYAHYMAAYGDRGTDWLKRHCLEVGDQRFMITVDITGPFNDPAVYANPFLHPILEALLGRQLVINSFGSVIAFPGSDAQHLHCDHPPLADDPALSGALPAYATTMVVPLVDLTPETGTTALIETSQWASPDDAEWIGAHPPVMPYMQRGGAYFMDYRLLHLGTENHSALPRPIMYVVYSRPWFLDAANYQRQDPIAISGDQFDRIPFKHRGLFARARPTASTALSM